MGDHCMASTVGQNWALKYVFLGELHSHVTTLISVAENNANALCFLKKYQDVLLPTCCSDQQLSAQGKDVSYQRADDSTLAQFKFIFFINLMKKNNMHLHLFTAV